MDGDKVRAGGAAPPVVSRKEKYLERGCGNKQNVTAHCMLFLEVGFTKLVFCGFIQTSGRSTARMSKRGRACCYAVRTVKPQRLHILFAV